MSVPILLVTGFLGAGKTTFINGLLQDAEGLKIAAIVNDFGSINIDAALLETASDEVIGLKNGCICCSLQGDLLRTIKQVMVQGTPDLIVLEASGVADPQGIIEGLMDPVLWQAAMLDTIVCLVDAEDLTASSDRWKDPLWRAQVDAADFVQLSKAEGADPDAVGTLITKLGAIGKRLVYGADGSTRPVRALIGSGVGARRTLNRPRIDASRFATLEWQTDSAISVTAFQEVIGRLSPGLLRAKGFLSFRERPGRPMLFQLVGQRASLSGHDGPVDGCELVLIGETSALDVDEARKELDTLTA
ncbi:CobW family GTP-binding protein [Chachezhania sediminis]|uniref:CobW family GTP-binding protein n=1 Tax=Chachezhania sediminis TaxID=2599291 RepID=UPI00131C0117|nr:CobW family GTP-binding protein [Chachezhania sediminis]